mmetsp:Transcript_30513/g.91125  ORF Transcript_30513/g.91125 Transcript_30513/m.91125 type:complete len:83 (+) Transcript_30513:2274-2522(+)
MHTEQFLGATSVSRVLHFNEEGGLQMKTCDKCPGMLGESDSCTKHQGHIHGTSLSSKWCTFKENFFAVHWANQDLFSLERKI